ncbi:twin-arginine translocase subunit TatC [Leifsonia sp. 2MCAF36]|uniref:twin-arginine translocase subunit TatC n=1 Tax=Leifsonia sp. 2MCAF36 TaxID=3232988 RepID=UPI003F963738
MHSAAAPDPERRMGLGDHISELRRRLSRAALGVVAGAVFGWFVAEPVLGLLRGPVLSSAQSQDRAVVMNFPSISAAFDLRVEIAIIVGVVASSPIWLYQLFAFFVPALHKKEKRYVYGFVLSALPLFASGCAAGIWVMPHIVQLMTGFAPQFTASYLDASAYFDFVLKLALITGVAFVLPLFVVVLNFAGVVSGRAVTHAWRWALIGICLFTAIATPAADVLSMLLLAAPMIALYVAACGVSLLNDRRRQRRLDAVLQPALTTNS